MSEKGMSVCKTLLLTLTSMIIFSIINRMSLNCQFFISQLTTNVLANYQLTTIFLAEYQLTLLASSQRQVVRDCPKRFP